ncbi:dTDP-4-dehydrorhamnose reductase [Polynucleobacter duraquae]|uniref:dTDP-4-dehydrorhamnose reductase n=1 Tax=Polynucleobacter duraquae TaxID=1835254 RepID=A0A0E3ZIN3_9BURK|nr:dTDP-4-dehydrorhamnose reductase [Polynucleobacter duraquae]AKD24596.1 dTDP-4-dehydrorhamnose reductase [Polynucleobacter duraquae]
MKILVFGKDGQLGKAFHAALSDCNLGLAKQLNIQYLGRSQCDLTSEQAIANMLDQFGPELIINASAYTAVDKAETEADLAFAVNARAPELMARYAAQYGATFLHFSTDYVFDGEKYGFYLENDLRNPLGVYGKSKMAGEEAIAKAFSKVANQLPGVGSQYAILRTSWVYGDGGNFIRTILRLAKDREELKVIEDQYGVPASAQWLAQVSLNLVMYSHGALREFPSGIYHAVPAGETSWHGLASLAVQAALEAGAALKLTPKAIKPIPAIEYPLPASRPMNSRMSTDKLHQVFEGRGDMSKLRLLNKPWDEAVRVYVHNVVQDGLN